MVRKVWQSKGLSSQQDARFAPMGSQLQVVLSAETGELVVSSTCDAEWGQSVQKLLSHWLELLCFWERPLLPGHTESPMEVSGRTFYSDVLIFDVTAGRTRI